MLSNYYSNQVGVVVLGIDFTETPYDTILKLHTILFRYCLGIEESSILVSESPITNNCLIVEKAGRRVEQRTVIKQRFLDGGMTDLYNYSSNS